MGKNLEDKPGSVRLKVARHAHHKDVRNAKELCVIMFGILILSLVYILH